MAHSSATLTDLVTRLPQVALADPEWQLCSEHFDGTLRIVIDDAVVDFSVEHGRLTLVTANGDDDARRITLGGPASVWTQMLDAAPTPFFHDPFGAAAHGFTIEGNLEHIAQNAVTLRRLVDLMRIASGSASEVPWEEPSRWEEATGRYVWITIDGVDYRVYVEQTGKGIPVLLQHTAGADGRQWRHLLANHELTQQFRFIAYDLPFHGKSLPPTGVRWWTQPYALTRQFLMSVPLALARLLDLDRPVFMGSSIGGHVAVDLAYYHPESFRAVIGLEAAIRQDPQIDVSMLDHPRISNSFKSTLMYGLTSPTAPEALRRETMFVYSQGAPPVFRGDLNFWQHDHDLRGLAADIDTTVCQVHLLTGEYDWATPPPLSLELAEQIPGATFSVMRGLGHFPMSEDPTAFLSYLQPVLDRVAATSVMTNSK